MNNPDAKARILPLPALAALPSWTCESNYIHCSRGHVLFLRDLREESPGQRGWAGDMRRLGGHAFLMCKTCRPHQYLFVIMVTLPDSHAVCYPIIEDDWRYWYSDPNPVTLATTEMLYRLRDPGGNRFNPTWRQQS